MVAEAAAARFPVVAAYEFEQLDAPPAGAIGGVADVLSAAWAEAEQVRAQARAAGEAEGRAEGLLQAREQAAPALAALAAAAAEVTALRDELAALFERDAIELALSLSEQIVAGAIAVQPERLVDVARGALRRLTERHRVTLIVNPDDLELLGRETAALSAELGGIDHLDVQSDRRIARGGAIARTESGEIDVTIAAQLQTAREIVEHELSGDEHAHDDDA